MKALVTGSDGFIGKNLVAALKKKEGVKVAGYDVGSPAGDLERHLSDADVVFHLAGVNRPERVEEFETGNAGLTETVCAFLRSIGRTPAVVLSSSTQALLDNPYGLSKRKAEQTVLDFGKDTGACVAVFRFPGVFGKWGRPNYNAVTVTFCYNIARGLPISISDPARGLELVYVDDVCAAMMEAAGLESGPTTHAVASGVESYREMKPVFTTTLGALAETIRSFRDSRQSLLVPSLDDPFVLRLYATYLSYLEETDFAYSLDVKTDNRGGLAEFLKSPSFGQIFVSHTKPGITRGNHYHYRKTEKFFVVQGDAAIRFRHILDAKVIEYRVSGREYRVVDIPPGYTHSIENVGSEELVTLFWAAEVFDQAQPDTYYEDVIRRGRTT